MPSIQLKRWRLAQEEHTFRDLFGHNKWTELSGSELAQNPELLEEFFAEIQTAYAPIGGHLKFKSPQTLLNGDFILYAVDVDEDPESDAVVVMEKNPPGEKLLGIGHDDSAAGKQKSVEKTKELLNSPGHYAEVSGAMAHILLKAGAKPVLEEKAVRQVLSGKDLEWLGAHPEGKYPEAPGWYQRSIGGTVLTKIMVGLPTGIKTGKLGKVAAAMRKTARDSGTLRSGDKAVIAAFAHREAKESRSGLLRTDGITLTKNGLGAQEIAYWAHRTCYITALMDSRSTQAIVRQLRRDLAKEDPPVGIQPKASVLKEAAVKRIAKATAFSEEEAFGAFLDFLSSANNAAQNIDIYLAALAEQEAEGEVKLPAQAEQWRAFLKLAQQRVGACKGFLVGKMVELFGVEPEDVVEEPTALPEPPE